MHGFSQSTISKELFPTLAGLQRTSCTKTIGENEYGTVWGSRSYLMQETQTTTIDGKQYMVFGDDQYNRFALREENNKILVYSSILKKDLVLYDFTLEVGDSLPALYFEERAHDTMQQWLYIGDIVDYNKDDDGTILPAETFVVTDISTITLLDGKEYKKWTFNNGMQYVEGIGSFGTSYAWNDFFQLIANVPQYSDAVSEHLVCVSKNGKLLYQLDEAEMDSLGVECLCDGYQSSYKDQWCDTWNVFVENGSVYPPHEETYRYQLAKDIVIGEHTYTTVVSKAINDALDAPHYVAAVRFTDDRKVYIYYDNAEYLLYDFNVQEGDELEVFAGINNYTSDIKTYKCTVTSIEQYACVGCPAAITLEVHNHPNDFREFYRQTQWIEGVGDINGFLNGLNGYINIPGNAEESLLCAYKGDELKYTGPLYEKYGCEYNANDPLPLYPWCNQWNILSHGQESDPDEPFPHARTSIYWLSENTVNRNGYEYIPLMCSSSKPNVESTHLVGELRFTENKQVYFYYDNTEYLLYDFGAQVGDQLQIFSGIDNYHRYKTYTHVVTRREYLEDGRIKLTSIPFFDEPVPDVINENNYLSVTWIEGVGSKHGIVHNNINYIPGMGTDWLLCAYHNDVCHYTTDNPEYMPLGCIYNEGDAINAVENVSPSIPSAQKIIKDGQVLILRNGKTYTMQGQEVK